MPALNDDLHNFDSGTWEKANNWTNGAFFNVGWREDHVTFQNGLMTLRLDTIPCPGGCSTKPYASGEYRTLEETFRYGRYSVRMKAAKGSGVVSSFFVFHGTGGTQDEIDIEITGKAPDKLHVNYFKNGHQSTPVDVPLGFDATQAFHVYEFDWQPNSITWFVDGDPVHEETSGGSIPLPTLAGKIMANLWTHNNTNAGIAAWLGPFHYTSPRMAQYDWIKFQPHP